MKHMMFGALAALVLATPLAANAAGPSDAPFSGRPPTHIDGTTGDGPKLHVPTTTSHAGNRSGAGLRLEGGGASGGPEVVRRGEGSGNAGTPGGTHIDNGAGDGPEVHQGPVHTAR